ncbi:MAG TPA: indole-3-glycerol phosphate synthase TrpC, partial [Dehalococcoidia bacterium]|nr:indole-3-glycerol phosphate synthase TrpC [Dehalococcoidia bacterium]
MSAIAGTYLEAIVLHKRLELEERYAVGDLHELRRMAEARNDQLSLAGALSGQGVQVIAEIKRRSPSKGEFKKQLDPVQYAEAYLAGGAAAISVLTDNEFFGGSLQDLRDVHSSVAHAHGLVILQKEFIIDERQVIEGAASGADAILLIVAALDRPQLRDLQTTACDLGLEVLVEVHDEDELDIALSAEARTIGVNNRDLRTFKTDLAVAERLLPRIPEGIVRVAESGIATRGDVERVSAGGADAVLVGEKLVVADDPAAT